MALRRNLIYLAVLIAAVVLPSALALGWYSYSKDPNMRPLGITREALLRYAARIGGFGEVDIVARVAWVPGTSGGYSRAALEQALINAFAAKGAEIRVDFVPAQGPVTLVTYEVGKSEIGPYTIARASEGIAAAVEAFRMYPGAD